MKKTLILFVATLFSVVAFGQERSGKCLSGGCNNGKGTWKWNDGDVISGYFSNKLPNGECTYKSADGTIQYIGGFKNGKRDGKNVTCSHKDFVYKGNFINDEFNDNEAYIEFINDKRGRKTYDGEIKGAINGKGTLIYVGDSIYRGDFHNGLRHGRGILTDKKGIILKNGEWINDVYSCQQDIVKANEIIKYINVRIDSLERHLSNKEDIKNEIIRLKLNDIIVNSLQSYDMALKIIQDQTLAYASDALTKKISQMLPKQLVPAGTPDGKILRANMKNILSDIDLVNKSYIDNVYDVVSKGLFTEIFGSDFVIPSCVSSGFKNLLTQGINENFGKEWTLGLSTPISESLVDQARRGYIDKLLEDNTIEGSKPMKNTVYEAMQKALNANSDCFKTALKKMKVSSFYINILLSAPELGIIFGNTFANYTIEKDIEAEEKEYAELKIKTQKAITTLKSIKHQYEKGIIFNNDAQLIDLNEKSDLVYKKTNECDFIKKWLSMIEHFYIISSDPLNIEKIEIQDKFFR